MSLTNHRPERPGLHLLLWALLLAMLSVAGIVFGTRSLGLSGLHEAFTDPASSPAIIFGHLRAPRTLLAITAGAGLGVAGALLQGHTRNSIADPVLLGISAGVGLFVAGAIYWLRLTTLSGYVWFGLAGSAFAAFAVWAIGLRLGSRSTELSLVLAGVAVHAGLGAITSGILILDHQALDTYRFWTVGSVSG